MNPVTVQIIGISAMLLVAAMGVAVQAGVIKQLSINLSQRMDEFRADVRDDVREVRDDVQRLETRVNGHAERIGTLEGSRRATARG